MQVKVELTADRIRIGDLINVTGKGLHQVTFAFQHHAHPVMVVGFAGDKETRIPNDDIVEVWRDVPRAR